MPVNVLITDGDKYGGKYVTTKSFKEKDVVSCGDDPVKVYEEAKQKGIEDPVIFYVPKRDTVHIY